MEKENNKKSLKSLTEGEKNVLLLNKTAKKLQDFVDKQQLSIEIVGKRYVLMEGWQFVAALDNVIPKVVKVENLSGDYEEFLPNGQTIKRKEIKWLVEVEVYDKNGNVVSKGFGLASSKEAKRRGQDEYAILSMAQTRAIAKALRNRYGWLMKLAGYEPTPAEEMEGIKEQVREEKIVKDSVEKIIERIKRENTIYGIKMLEEKIKKPKIWNYLTEEQKEKINKVIEEKKKELNYGTEENA
jgi:hypothetical protein